MRPSSLHALANTALSHLIGGTVLPIVIMEEPPYLYNGPDPAHPATPHNTSHHTPHTVVSGAPNLGTTIVYYYCTVILVDTNIFFNHALTRLS
jgi:hypothetical protein